MYIDIENDYVFLSILHAKLENCALVLTWLVTSKHFRVERIIFVLFPEGFSSHLCFFAVSFLLIVSALRGKRKAGRNLCWLASTLSLFRPSSVRLPRNHAPAHFACNRVPISTGWSSNRHEGAPKKLQRKLPQKHRTHFVFRCPPISILAIGEKEREKRRDPRGHNLLPMAVRGHGEGEKPSPIPRPGHHPRYIPNRGQVLKRIVKCLVGFLVPSTAPKARSAPVPVLRRQGEDKGKAAHWVIFPFEAIQWSTSCMQIQRNVFSLLLYSLSSLLI